MDDLTFLPAHALAQLIRQREVTSTEVLEAHLSRINEYNPALNAIVTLNTERARERAREADAALTRGELWGPLHGVPVTIKDAFDTAGLRTTFGYRLMKNRIPQRNATAVERILEAGAILLGKTNIPEVSFDWQTNSPIFGRTNNPWDLSRTPGGSTGGGAAAVSAGLSPLEIGSDGAGSIRIPAHFCGVFGFKPTTHRVSGTGHMEIPSGEPRGYRHISSYGPLARSVEDLRLAFSIIAGPDSKDWEIPPLPLSHASTNLTQKRLSDCRFAWAADFGGVPVNAETRAALEKLVERLKKSGCRVERARPPDFDFNEAVETCGEITGTEAGSQTPFYMRAAVPFIFELLFGRSPWSRGFVRGELLNMRRYARALARRDSFITQMEDFLAGWDAWLCPVASVPAFTHRRKGKRIEVDGQKLSYSMALGTYVTVFNLLDNPVVVVPLALSEGGLPIGVQVVGARWKDMELLDTAEMLARVAGGYKRPPNLLRASS
jgi:amidase